MDLAFATDQFDPQDRLAAWRELVNREFLPLAITPLTDSGRPGRPGRSGRPGEFRAAATVRALGELQVWRLAASPMSAVRARQHIESTGDDGYLLALHLAGTAHATQDGREVTLGPGDFTLFDSRRPYSIAFTGAGAFKHVIYRVPRASLNARRGIGAAATAVRVPAASSAGQLASPYLRTLVRSAPDDAFIEAGLDLVAAALRAVTGHHDQAERRGRSQVGPLKTIALARLGDHALSPEAVAAAAYVSARQLQRLFAADGLTFSGWVREQRLRRCRDDLTDRSLRQLSIAEIAARWGFRSAAHFTRAFRERYGITPSDCRHASR